MPLVKNSTAMSGLPLAALKQWRTSASGKPIEVKLLTTSSGNAGPSLALALASDAVDSVGAEAAASVGGDEVADSEALFSSSEAGSVAAGAAAAGAFAVSTGAAGAAAGAGAFAAVFFALVTITTKKSFCFIPQPAS
jgi:hypothetical protein